MERNVKLWYVVASPLKIAAWWKYYQHITFIFTYTIHAPININHSYLHIPITQTLFVNRCMSVCVCVCIWYDGDMIDWELTQLFAFIFGLAYLIINTYGK